MSNNGFNRSIGGKIGSGSINASSVGMGRAGGGAVTGYAMPKKSTAPHAAPQHGAKAPEPARPVRPTTRNDEYSSIKRGGGKPPNGGRF